jgi:hypothetical protein
LITKKYCGDVAIFDIIREGKKQKINVLMSQQIDFVPPKYYYDKPSYFIFSGLVFSILCKSFQGIITKDTDSLISKGKIGLLGLLSAGLLGDRLV